MEIKATLTKEGWKEITETLYIRKVIGLYILLYCFILVIGFLVKNLPLRICILVGGTIGCLPSFYFVSSIRKRMMARFTEVAPGGSVDYIYQFGDLELNVHNLLSGLVSVVKYADLSEYKTTKHYATLQTRGGYSIVMDLEAAEEADVRGFVKKRNPRLKG